MAGAEILKKIFFWYFGRSDVFKKSFQFLLTFNLKIALTLIGMCDPKFQSLTEFTTQHYHRCFGFRAKPAWPGKVNLQFILIVEKICEHFCIVYMSLLDCLYVCLCAVLYIFEIVLRTSKQ